MPEQGSFGLLGYNYRIDPDSVTLSRKVWLSVPGLALAAFAVWRVSIVFGTHYQTRTDARFAFMFQSMLPLVLGLAILAVGLTPPWRVRLTKDTLRWGGVVIPTADIASFAHGIKSVATRHGVHRFHMLEVAAPIITRPLRLARARLGSPPAVLETVAAMNQLLARAKGVATEPRI